MDKLLRNFFYAVGFLVLTYLYTADPQQASLTALARLIQSSLALYFVVLMTLAITFGDYLWNVTFCGSKRKALDQAILNKLGVQKSDRSHIPR